MKNKKIKLKKIKNKIIDKVTTGCSFKAINIKPKRINNSINITVKALAVAEK